LRIPVIYADEAMKVTLPTVGQGWRARGAAAGEVGNLMETISRHQAALQEQERLAQDTLAAIETDNAMRKKFAATVESFQGRTDTAKFNPDFDKASASIKNEFYPKNVSKERQVAFARSYNRNDSNSRTQVTSMKYKVMEENGRIAIGESMDNYADQYAAATDDATKKFISKQAELDIRKAIDANLVNRVWGENQIRNLEASFKAAGEVKAVTAAQNFILENPDGGSEALKASPIWDKIPDKDKPRFIKGADDAKKSFARETKAKQQEAEKVLHEADDDAIWAEISKGNWSKASTMIYGSTLDPHEQNSWLSTLSRHQSGAEGPDAKHPTEEYDPLTYAKVSDKVWNTPKDINSGKIYKLVGKGKDGGLTTKQAEYFSDHLKKNLKALKEPANPKDAVRAKEVTTALGLLKTNYSYGVFGKGWEGDVNYQQTIEEFLQWAEANPDKDPSEKLEQILTPIKEEHTKNILEQAWDTLMTKPEGFDEIWGNKPTAPKPKPTPVQPKDKRQQAIDILNNAGLVVNDETIANIMSQLK